MADYTVLQDYSNHSMLVSGRGQVVASSTWLVTQRSNYQCRCIKQLVSRCLSVIVHLSYSGSATEPVAHDEGCHMNAIS